MGGSGPGLAIGPVAGTTISKELHVDQRYIQSVEEMGLFGEGICEVCGKRGFHAECDAKVVDLEREYREHDGELLKAHARYGAYGIIGPDSVATYNRAREVLQRYLGRELESSAEEAIEGNSWWYFAEGWIGMIGFVVEKDGAAIFPLGSGLSARCRRPHTPANWSGILAYLAGAVAAGEDKE